jgi:multisubunit Na+/H+ antiporter MnhB subunit
MHNLGMMGVGLALAGAATPFIILWQRHTALRHRVIANRQPTEHECTALQKRGRQSIAAFVLFWLVSLSLVFAVSFFRAPDAAQLAVVALILLLALVAIAFQLETRCPICQYRLRYQSELGVPERCERCRANFPGT